MNKKLRLLVTTRCPNKCPMCCNNSWDFDKLPVVDRWNYEEIMITGGEPLLHLPKLCSLASSIKDISKAQGSHTKLYVYTSVCDWHLLVPVLGTTDGVVLTPHSKRHIDLFIELNNLVNDSSVIQEHIKHASLRLNLFPDMKVLLPKDIDLSLWQVKDMEWKKDCPVPEGEDFRRIANLW